MKLTRLLGGVLGTLFILGLASCAKNENEFVLGLDDAFPPMGFRNEDNEIVGYDIDLGKEVAKRLGLTFRAQPISWSANGLSITTERLAALSFTKPYLNNAQVVIVRANSGIKTLSDLAGKNLGVQAGSSAADAIDGNPAFKKSLKEIFDFGDNLTALGDLEVGGLDGIAMDKVVAEYCLTITKKPFVILDETLAPEQYGVAFKKDNTELRDKVQKALEDMAADGTIAEISKKWFGSDISIVGKL